jgi:hypothetical protein
MKIEDILTNLFVTCEQNNQSTQDVVLLYVMSRLQLIDYDNIQYDLLEFKQLLRKEHDLLWDLQPTIEDDEDHAFAVQHARDIYNILVGRELC